MFSVLFALLCITSVAEVLCLLFLLLLWVLSALAAPSCCVLLLILVHLRFPLGVLRLAALLGFPAGSSFPNGRPSGKRSSSSYVFMVVGAS